jgi:hypothetical protein
MSLNFNPQVMRRALAVLGSALFLVIAPGVVAVLVPWWISKWIVQDFRR